uniref:CCHC-type domain-containing protein n=1 Tax=Tanacetum cinerariifolium TaxID=118510 RepID=A0A699I795_TANCI|nr:hypothetical protein [Tanacetum cinerariifolium]
MSWYNHPGCSCYGGPFNGGNCMGCNNLGSRNEFVYDPNPNSFDNPPDFPYQYPQHQYETNSCEFCGNDAHYGYDCPPQVPFVYNQDPCYNQNSDNFPQTSPSFQQQYICCENYGGPHETFQCQPLNQNFYEPNHCYNSNSFGFDQSQPSQFLVIHQPPQETSVEILHDQENVLAEYINTLSWNCHAFYNNGEDDDEDYTIAITPDFLITDSLIMGDENLDTVLQKESNEFIKSSVENLVPNPSESEDFPDIEKECDVPDCGSSIISYPKFDSLLEEFFGELAHIDLVPPGINEADFDPEEEIHLDERLLYDNSSPRLPEDFKSKNSDVIIGSFSPSPIPVEDSDPFIEEIDLFLASDRSIPPGIDSDYSNSKGDNLFLERLLYNDPIPLLDILDSSNVVCVFLPFFTYPDFLDIEDLCSCDDRSFSDEDIPKETYLNPLFDEEFIDMKIDLHHFNVETDLIESLLNRDSPIISSSSKIDSLFDEFAELISNDSLSLPENESFHFDIPSSSRPLAKPPDDNTGILNVKVMGDIFKHEVPMPRFMPTLVPNQEKSPSLLSHLGHKAFQLSTECPMMIYGRNTPILDVPFFHFYPP